MRQPVYAVNPDQVDAALSDEEVVTRVRGGDTALMTVLASLGSAHPEKP